MNFWETAYGHNVSDLILKELNNITEELKKANEIKIRELEAQGTYVNDLRKESEGNK